MRGQSDNFQRNNPERKDATHVNTLARLQRLRQLGVDIEWVNSEKASRLSKNEQVLLKELVQEKSLDQIAEELKLDNFELKKWYRDVLVPKLQGLTKRTYEGRIPKVVNENMIEKIKLKVLAIFRQRNENSVVESRDKQTPLKVWVTKHRVTYGDIKNALSANEDKDSAWRQCLAFLLQAEGTTRKEIEKEYGIPITECNQNISLFKTKIIKLDPRRFLLPE